MELHFVRLTGAGNDFVGLNNLRGALGESDREALARTVCDRHFGIGGDGLLVLDPSSTADFRMMYYNADGSYGGMCGNGGRCAAVYARSVGVSASPVRFEALDHIYEAEFLAEGVRLKMKDPRDIARNISVRLPDGLRTVHAIDTGSPHIVLFVSDLNVVRVEGTGRLLREHAQFAPVGTNVNFVRQTGPDSIEMRTYERGVEAETLACGTGSVASAIISHLEHGLQPPVSVKTRSGQLLRVNFRFAGQHFTDVTLEGPAIIICSGKALYNPSTHTLQAS